MRTGNGWSVLRRCAGLAVAGVLLSTPHASAQQLGLETVASGLSAPLFAHAPAGDDRLFILEQNSGLVRLLQPDGTLSTFLDVEDEISSGGERGLLGLAFHPDYALNGHLFVNYTDRGGDSVVARYTVSADPDLADPTSALVLLTVGQPFSNHNGGMLAFGPDGYLYVGLGDGGAGGDPGDRSQDGQELLGKILRLDVDASTPLDPYAIPADNPFVGDPAVLDEIWAIGVRNPWRFSFDRSTGDLYIGDVGQDVWEEISFQPAASSGGENYGWRLKEGNQCFNPPSNCDPGGLTDPIYEYRHGFGGGGFRCSVTGGYVYRGESLPLLQGEYFFGDYCSSEVFSLIYDGTEVTSFEDRTSELDPFSTITSFGEDGEGELYIVSGGSVLRVVAAMALGGAELTAGETATLTVTGAPSNSEVFLGVSLVGTGRTPVPQLDVEVALEAPRPLGSATSDGNGQATFSIPVPAGAAGREVWLQVAVDGNTSNVVRAVVQ